MAKFLFIFRNIILFFKSEKILSLFILLGMIVCDTIFLVFGNIFWSDAKSNEYKIYENNIVTFQFDVLDIDKYLEVIGSRDYITSAFFRYTEINKENYPVIISAYSPSFDADNQRIRLGHELTGDSKECVVSSWYMDQKTSVLSRNIIDSELHFLDTGWTCVGIISPSIADNFDILINMADFKECVENQITTGFRYEKGVSLMEVQDFVNYIKEEFHANYAVVPSKTVGVGFGEFLSDISEMLILLVIAIINYMSLYRFLLQKRMYAYGIFKLQGMDNCLTLVGLSIEMLFFLVVAFAFSLLLYLGGTVLLGQTGTVMQHVAEFYFSFLIISVINLFFFLFTVVKLIHNSPIKLMRESVVG